eukprot:TRINITY_DN563_c0_g1_i2.p1 TRINITY_DN563_c0_g1~~TRINITY_DN563_c0_g1_i2.p1  ORF type:complete len:594 (-),score=125.58 TRINITY_DN563_c0_g1_i2:2-1699(-)
MTPGNGIQTTVPLMASSALFDGNARSCHAASQITVELVKDVIVTRVEVTGDNAQKCASDGAFLWMAEADDKKITFNAGTEPGKALYVDQLGRTLVLGRSGGCATFKICELKIFKADFEIATLVPSSPPTASPTSLPTSMPTVEEKTVRSLQLLGDTGCCVDENHKLYDKHIFFPGAGVDNLGICKNRCLMDPNCRGITTQAVVLSCPPRCLQCGAGDVALTNGVCTHFCTLGGQCTTRKEGTDCGRCQKEAENQQLYPYVEERGKTCRSLGLDLVAGMKSTEINEATCASAAFSKCNRTNLAAEFEMQNGDITKVKHDSGTLLRGMFVYEAQTGRTPTCRCCASVEYTDASASTRVMGVAVSTLTVASLIQNHAKCVDTTVLLGVNMSVNECKAAALMHEECHGKFVRSAKYQMWGCWCCSQNSRISTWARSHQPTPAPTLPLSFTNAPSYEAADFEASSYVKAKNLTRGRKQLVDLAGASTRCYKSKFSTREEAEAACNPVRDCKFLVDNNCRGIVWTACVGYSYGMPVATESDIKEKNFGCLYKKKKYRLRGRSSETAKAHRG